MYVPTKDREITEPIIKSVFPSFFNPLIHRAFRPALLVSLAAQHFLSQIKRSDIVYLWPGTPLSLYRSIRGRGIPIIMERVNTHRQTAKEILDVEYSSLKLTPDYIVTAESIKEETEKLISSDYVFSPSPHVTESLVRVGISSSKILQSTYGWAPYRLQPSQGIVDTPNQKSSNHCTFLFVGTICVRKGAHLLLEAWQNFNSKCSLLLKGNIRFDNSLHRAYVSNRKENIHFIPYSRNVSETFADADIFIFPTLEEGSPLVVYEAMAMGLPIITTPMGAGSVVRNGIDGLVVSPHNQQQLVEAMRALATNHELRVELGRNARKRAMDFTWDKVAASRAAMLNRCFLGQ